MKNYTKQDVMEMRELMKENYERCLTMDVPANVDGVLYYIKNDGKIVAYGCENEDDDTLMLTDLFDEVSTELLNNARKVKKIVLDKEIMETATFTDYYINLDINAEYVVDVYSLLNGSDWDKECASDKEKNIKSLTLKNACFIRKKALSNSIYMERLELGRVHTIEDGGLYNCKKLTDVDFHCVEYMGKAACSHCDSLEFVDLTGLSKIQEYTFAYCKNLKKVRISSKCQHIEDRAFAGCENLKMIEFEGTQQEWFKLSQNLRYWRGHIFNYRNNRLRMTYIGQEK